MSTLKSHKLLGRPCPTAGKQEDCLTLKSHKLLTRSCSGDPRCEHSSNLKPHKLLSRSYSSSLRMEELYGLKNHKLLSKSYSGAPKSSKTEHFKEPNAEGRRLSLTSGLIGILTPSSSSSQPPVRKHFFHLAFLNVAKGQDICMHFYETWERKTQDPFYLFCFKFAGFFGGAYFLCTGYFQLARNS